MYNKQTRRAQQIKQKVEVDLTLVLLISTPIHSAKQHTNSIKVARANGCANRHILILQPCFGHFLAIELEGWFAIIG
jgi:hypothetical protein